MPSAEPPADRHREALNGLLFDDRADRSTVNVKLFPLDDGDGLVKSVTMLEPPFVLSEGELSDPQSVRQLRQFIVVGHWTSVPGCPRLA